MHEVLDIRLDAYACRHIQAPLSLVVSLQQRRQPRTPPWQALACL